jgi:two-component system phosphate regulon sensor histidine kinase PhoR
MKIAQGSKSLLIFYILVIYVFCQFCWWSILLFNLNKDLYELKASFFDLQGIDMNAEMQQKLHLKWLMIFGEGLVFITLLAVGILQTRKSFRKEALLAKQQNNFLLSITHELKSPIASIKLYLQTFGKHELKPEKKQELVARAVNDADRLNSLVENILLVSRIDNDSNFLNFSTINLSKLCKEVYAHFHNETHQIEAEIEPNLFVAGDELALQSVLLNLLENAVKYSPESKRIKIKLSSNDQEVILEVLDWGMGVKAEDQERIFQRFYRVGNEETRLAKGTGLGLYIVKYLVNQHKAKIQVMNNEPMGSIFQVKFKPTVA